MCKVCTEADRFEQNPAAGQIFRNRPAGQIFRNRPTGQMFRNRPAGQILRNWPAGQITPNRPAGQITPNRPAGQITLNRPAGQTGWLAGIKIVNEIRVQWKTQYESVKMLHYASFISFVFKTKKIQEMSLDSAGCETNFIEVH